MKQVNTVVKYNYFASIWSFFLNSRVNTETAEWTGMTQQFRVGQPVKQ